MFARSFSQFKSNSRFKACMSFNLYSLTSNLKDLIEKHTCYRDDFLLLYYHNVVVWPQVCVFQSAKSNLVSKSSTFTRERQGKVQNDVNSQKDPSKEEYPVQINTNRSVINSVKSFMTSFAVDDGQKVSLFAHQKFKKLVRKF